MKIKEGVYYNVGMDEIINVVYSGLLILKIDGEKHCFETISIDYSERKEIILEPEMFLVFDGSIYLGKL